MLHAPLLIQRRQRQFHIVIGPRGSGARGKPSRHHPQHLRGPAIEPSTENLHRLFHLLKTVLRPLGHHPFADRHQFRSRVGPQPKDILRLLRTMCANPFHQRARGKRRLARQQKIQRATQTVEISACGHLVAIDRLLTVAATAGSVTLTNAANSVAAATISNGNRAVSFVNALALTLGGLTMGTGSLTVDVGPQPNGLLQSGGTLDLRAVQGASIIRNGGRIVGNPILRPPGTGIQVGGAITTPAELNAAVSTLNSLPASPGPTYEIFVASNMTLTQQLAVSRPVIFRGASQSTVVSGSSGVTNGLLLDSGASGSVIRDIAFSSFSGDAIRLTSATGITIKGIQANNSGNGLSITGASTNTVVQGNTFDRNQTGVSLVSAAGALIGGAATGQGNVISSAVRQGVFASGFCTGSQVVKNTFPGTATPYNVSASRNLTIVN